MFSVLLDSIIFSPLLLLLLLVCVRNAVYFSLFHSWWLMGPGNVKAAAGRSASKEGLRSFKRLCGAFTTDHSSIITFSSVSHLILTHKKVGASSCTLHL